MPSKGASKGRPNSRPPNRIAENRACTMVGFILMKVSSLNHRVSPPNTPITVAVITGISGTRRSIARDSTKATPVAAITAMVAGIRPADR